MYRITEEKGNIHIVLYTTFMSWHVSTLFRNKRFMLDEMTSQNASKFAIFLEYENPHSFFFISCNFIFPPNECPGL